MLRKALTQITTKPAESEQIMESCQQVAQTNEQTNPLEKEVAGWIEILEILRKCPEDIPDYSEIPHLSPIQLEELWIRIGMIKETLSQAEITAAITEKNRDP
uniref:Uncharacterized protein n=1 Tax=Panagrolaimus sp. ES5 TaxID=591445 RepID=A0AC34FJA4_9BILA